eukprot:TRINITY_DN325_c2_g1_i8.p1 TRINITY_DN325_c2_g1~~TRINITY_DN325_c2_g1_i8.p1  ORF type:complete len:199 (+),score=25.91 TRINITY_DN325_c2_g1_i8:459-1055(+)
MARGWVIANGLCRRHAPCTGLTPQRLPIMPPPVASPVKPKRNIVSSVNLSSWQIIHDGLEIVLHELLMEAQDDEGNLHPRSLGKWCLERLGDANRTEQQREEKLRCRQRERERGRKRQNDRQHQQCQHQHPRHRHQWQLQHEWRQDHPHHHHHHHQHHHSQQRRPPHREQFQQRYQAPMAPGAQPVQACLPPCTQTTS